MTRRKKCSCTLQWCPTSWRSTETPLGH
ncbi:hypothetical protein ID866_12853 [Astraeus odoratus]|nr:hypothetical protein ID866_12853 [Astraeus odoratus]